jgi:hypothetical protein
VQGVRVAKESGFDQQEFGRLEQGEQARVPAEPFCDVVWRMVKKLEWIEMAQLAVSSIVFKSLSLKLP